MAKRGCGCKLKTLKLRMVFVAACLAANDRLGQQRLTPQGNQPLWVQVFGMQRP